MSNAYAAERARAIRPDRINPNVAPGQAPSRGDTTYFTVADRNGMMVSLIQSNFREGGWDWACLLIGPRSAERSVSL